jgi:transposase
MNVIYILRIKAKYVLEREQRPSRLRRPAEGAKITVHCENHTKYTSKLYGKLYSLTPLNHELNPICCLLALLGAHHFLHVSSIRVKSLTLRLLMSYMTLVA